MSEEQTGFKVTDRRLFNADGTPRDLPPEETKAEAKASDSGEQAAPAAASAPSAPQPDRAQPERTSSAEPSSEVKNEADLSDAEDPASFLSFLMSIASNAAASLGMMEHPVTHQRDVDLELGKHWIDVLGMLQQKTHGNLTPQEVEILEGLLGDLRMQFVSLAGSPSAKASRGFTGSDITGGK